MPADVMRRITMAPVSLDAARGVLYATDQGGVRRISLVDGSVTTRVTTVFTLGAVAPDGSVWLAQQVGARATLWLLLPDSDRPDFVAGGVPGPSAADPAGSAAVFNRGIASLAAGPDGAAWVSDIWSLRRVGRDGVVQTMAGDPVNMFPQITGYYHQLVVRPDGEVIAFDSLRSVLRSVYAPVAVGSTFVPGLPRIAGLALEPGGSLRLTFPHAYGRVDAGGQAAVIAGTPEPDDNATFPAGHGLAVDSQGAVYTTLAQYAPVVIRKFDASGRAVPFGAGPGDLQLSSGKLSLNPNGSLCVDAADNLYEVLANTTLGESTAYRISPDGQVQVLFTFASARLAFTVSPDGTPYFVDDWTGIAWKWTLGRFIALGTVPLQRLPTRVVADDDGRIFMLAGGPGINRIQQGSTFMTLAGDGGAVGHVDARGLAARFLGSSDIALDSQGNVWVRDFDTIRKVTPAGDVTTVAGTSGQVGARSGALPGTLGHSTARPPSSASLDVGFPVEDIALGRDGTLYVRSDHAVLKIRVG